MSRFSGTIKEFAELIVDVQKEDWDVVMVTTGTPGVGKSVFNFQLLYAVCKVLREKEIATNYFDPTRDLWFSRDEVNDWLDEQNQYAAGGADEGVGMFYARDYHEPEQKALLKKMDRMREEKNFAFNILIPSFYNVDSHIRKGRITYWVHLDIRKGKGKKGYAHAVIYQMSNNEHDKDPWNQSLNAKLRRQGRIEKSPNYVGEIYFKDIEDDHKKVYKEVKKIKRLLAEMEEWAQAKNLGRRR